MTVLDLITNSLRLIGVLGQGQTPSGSMANDALVQLQNMTASWGLDRRKIYRSKRELFAITATDGQYTIGPGGDFNTTRPDSIKKANVITAAGLTVELNLLGEEDWGAVKQKAATAPYPENLHNDGAHPLSTLWLHPVPTLTGSTLELWSWLQFTGFDDLTLDISLPPGYARALTYSLALELAPEYPGLGQVEYEGIARIAAESLGVIGALNAPPVPGAAQEAAQKAPAAPQQ